jgi:threonine aldolase
LAVPVDARCVRMVTHRDVSRDDVERAADATAEVVKELKS